MTTYRRIVGWPAHYRVGDDGTLWSSRRGGVWRRLKTTPTNGHPRAVLTDRAGKTRFLSLAVLICRAFHGPRPIGCEVLHYPDPDPANCQAANLRWAPIGTSKLGKDPIPGRHPEQRGEKNPLSRLNAELVIWARAEYAAGRTTHDLGQELGVSETAIRLAVTGQTWGHIPGAAKRAPRRIKGGDVNTSRLMEREVLEIRRKHAAGRSQRSLAREYDVTQAAIRLIVLRKNWAHLPEELAPRPAGEANPHRHKLVKEQVIEIRRKHADGRTQHSLAREYGVTQTTIRLIVIRKNWAHLPEE